MKLAALSLGAWTQIGLQRGYQWNFLLERIAEGKPMQQAWWQAPSLAEPSHWPICFCFMTKLEISAPLTQFCPQQP